jgi:glutamyl-tRNA synthetase
MDKLTWLNGHYLKTLPAEDVAGRLCPFRRHGDKGRRRQPSRQGRRQPRERARTLKEMPQMAEYFFRDDFALDEAARAKFLTPATKTYSR